MQVLLRAGIVVAILAGIGLYVYRDRNQVPLRTELARGEQALVVNDLKTADQVAAIARRRAPNAPETLVYLGQVEMRKGKYDEALAYLRKVPDGTPDTVSARGVEARITMIHSRDFLKSEKLYQEAIAMDPDNDYALENYGSLLLATARVPEFQKNELALLKYGHPSIQRLVMINMADVLSTDAKLMQAALQKFPQDYTAHAAIGDWMIRRNSLDEAVKSLREAVKLNPELMDAQANLGQALMFKRDDVAFVEWNRLLPASANQHPKVWTVRGDWALAHGQTEAAARCYWESLKLEGAQIKPAYLLGNILFSSQQSEGKVQKKELITLALSLLKLAYQLHDYSTAIREQAGKLTKDSDLKEFQAFAGQARSIGLLLEALAWLEIDHFAGDTSKETGEVYKEVKTALGSAPLIRLHPSKNPALQTDLSSYPLPDMTIPAKQPPQGEASSSSISFEDQADTTGIKFQYFNGGDPKERGPGRLSEMLGGGIAVLDYDQDGLPDLYLTQGCAWPVESGQTQYLDRLYRNRGDGQFEDVTAQAGLVEDRFSQGVSAGDFNNDGFPDLYVANIGRNRLFLNNGDGTFSDVSASSGTLAGDFWTTSCAIADVNGDHLPDLYSANFLANDALKVDCRKGKPEERVTTCLTSAYRPAQDQVYLNLGRGNFRDVTKSLELDSSDGRGTGLLVGDLDGTGRMAVMVGQEAGKNACYVNITKPGQPPKITDRAWMMGIALSSAGFPPAPFGIAGGDVNDDGKLDLMTTNRIGQMTTLYMNQSGPNFQDATLPSLLRDPTFRMNGFGAQLLDADLDSHLDLVQTNGDTTVSTDPEVGYELPPLAFRNLGQGRFQQLKPEALGKYFQGKYLGRSLARIDWNQDGLEDVVISHLDKPVALLTNTTKEHGNFLKIQLRGVTSPRDPIGAKVQLKIGDRTVVGQLLAGDGFQASNEHVLNFGLGKATQADEITIRWPSGKEQKLGKVDANRSILVVEDKETPVLLWKKG
ncbi:MAG: FG-GAP-like repeat-containing protein [Planctomycetales bacterium]